MYRQCIGIYFWPLVVLIIDWCGETGALRSLAELGGEYACERLVRDDCMTPLLGILTHRNAEAANPLQKTLLFSHVFATISALWYDFHQPRTMHR
jgi:hypothetical protein